MTRNNFAMISAFRSRRGCCRATWTRSCWSCLATARSSCWSSVPRAPRGRTRRLGSVPERLCQAGTVPVLIARNADGVEAWSRGSRSLRVLLGSGLGDASRRALDAISGWSELSLTVAHIAWPFGEQYRLGGNGPIPLDHLRPEVHHQLLGDLGRWVGQSHCAGSVKLSVTPSWGRVEQPSCSVGARQGSRSAGPSAAIAAISPNAFGRAPFLAAPSMKPTATCCVCRTARRRPRWPLRPRVVVIATDFSRLADPRAARRLLAARAVGARLTSSTCSAPTATSRQPWRSSSSESPSTRRHAA